MERLVKGDVIVLPFPFTDLSSSKKRPALVLAGIGGTDYIMLQITSKNVRDPYAIPLSDDDFQSGSLKQSSNIRPNKIFTLHHELVLSKIGHLTDGKINECVQRVCHIITSS